MYVVASPAATFTYTFVEAGADSLDVPADFTESCVYCHTSQEEFGNEPEANQSV